MRLLATVEIFNIEFSSINHRPINSKCKSKLTIGKKRPKDVHPVLVICSNSNKNGTNYEIHQNIVQIFSNRSNQGIATIRFKSPKHDIFVSKADSIQLKAFLKILESSANSKKGTSKNNNTVNFSLLTPFSNKEVAKTKLTILNKSDYPITTNFPLSLTNLTINSIKMTKIDLRIFNLKKLKKLDFSDNSLREIPAEGWDGLLSLVDLNLSSNKITRFSSGICCSKAASTLRNLNLTCNKLVRLPWQISNLQSLAELHLKANLLESLPDSLTRLKQLKSLDLSNNKLTFLPGGFLHMKLISIDLTFQTPHDVTSHDTHATPSFPASLYELAARCVVDNKLSCTDIDALSQTYMYTHTLCCYCGKTCFESVLKNVRDTNLNRLAEVVLRDKDMPLVLYACSFKCQHRTLNHCRF